MASPSRAGRPRATRDFAPPQGVTQRATSSWIPRACTSWSTTTNSTFMSWNCAAPPAWRLLPLPSPAASIPWPAHFKPRPRRSYETRRGSAPRARWQAPGLPAHAPSNHALEMGISRGKIEEGEQPRDALRRELEEELGILATIGDEVSRIQHEYPNGGMVELRFYVVREYKGELENRIFRDLQWARPEDLRDFDFLEADRTLVNDLVDGKLL